MATPDKMKVVELRAALEARGLESKAPSQTISFHNFSDSSFPNSPRPCYSRNVLSEGTLYICSCCREQLLLTAKLSLKC